MRDFEFLEPKTVKDASVMLADHGEDCRMISGGTALMLALRQRMVNPTHLISLGRIESMRGISYDEKLGLRVGARTLHSEIAASSLVRERCPMLADMASRVANPQVRNQGTIGGNLCYADPATDPPSCLMALGATIVASGIHGDRELPIEDFLVDYYTTDLKGDEILAEIRVPPVDFTLGRHVRFLRTAAEHRPMINLAITATHDGGLCREAQIVIGATTPVPSHVVRCEDFLAGRTLTYEVAEEAARIAATDINAISDIRGSEEYRRDMVRVVTRRTLCELFGLKDH
jgi:aerobic carbon-monoxide dehydrogenase medium subunit